MRVLQSEPELKMLEEIENKYEFTQYEFKPGMHVDFITPEVVRHIRAIYTEMGSHKRQKVSHSSCES